MKKYILATLLAASALAAKELEMRPAKLVKADSERLSGSEWKSARTVQRFVFEQGSSKYSTMFEIVAFTSACRLVVGKSYDIGLDTKKHTLKLVDDEGKKRSLRIVGEELVSQ